MEDDEASRDRILYRISIPVLRGCHLHFSIRLREFILLCERFAFGDLIILSMGPYPYYQSAIPVLEAIDPYQLYISYKLFRESTGHVDGHIVKVGGYQL